VIKTPERKSTYKMKDFFFAHGFKDFSPWSLSSIDSGPVVKKNMMMVCKW
jgi:hypothetical protein